MPGRRASWDPRGALRRRRTPPTLPTAYVERHVPATVRWSLSLLASMGNWASDLLVSLRRGMAGAPPPVCRLDGPPVVVRGTALPDDEKTYVVLPFVVPPGATRVDIDYDWNALPPALPENPITQTVLD